MSSSLCLSLPAYAECPVESGGSSRSPSSEDDNSRPFRKRLRTYLLLPSTQLAIFVATAVDRGDCWLFIAFTLASNACPD